MEESRRLAKVIHDFLRFRKLITPLVIEVIFWLLTVGLLGLGVISIVGADTDYPGGTAGLVWGILMILLGPVFARIGCELVLVQFGIHRTLRGIRDVMQLRSTDTETPRP